MVDRLRSFNHSPFSVVFLTHKNCGLIFRFAKPLTGKCSTKILRLKVAKLQLNFGILSQNCDWNFSLILSPDIHYKFLPNSELDKTICMKWTKKRQICIPYNTLCRHTINIAHECSTSVKNSYCTFTCCTDKKED